MLEVELRVPLDRGAELNEGFQTEGGYQMQLSREGLNQRQIQTLENWGDQDKSCSEVVAILTAEHYHGEGNWSIVTDLLDLINTHGWAWDEELPGVEPVRIEKPEREKLEVGSFMRETYGDSLELFANCSTKVSLTDNGDLRFEGKDPNEEEAICELRIDQLISRLQDLERTYQDSLVQYENQVNGTIEDLVDAVSD